MKTVNPRTRIAFLAALVVVAFVGLALWIGRFQVVEHKHYQGMARGNIERRSMRPPLRGSILDSRGTLLARSIPVKTVCADPSLMGTQQVLIARTLAPLLQTNQADLLRLLQPRLRTNAEPKSAEAPNFLQRLLSLSRTNTAPQHVLTNAYVVLKHQVSIEQWQQITQAMAGLSFGLNEPKLRINRRLALQAIRQKSIFGQDDFLRQYPGRALAAHALGYVSNEQEETDHGKMFATHGLNGVERIFDKQLMGVPGWRNRNEDVAPTPGMDVVLTIDAGVQNIVENELEKAMRQFMPKSLSAIVVRPRTGELLALANYPSYDPANAPAFPPLNLRNRAISDPSEPGSTFKVITVAAALDAGAVTLRDIINCGHGRFVFAGRTLHDHAPYDDLSVETIITKSSNIGAAKIGIKLQADRLHRYLVNFGFGSPTGILLAGESRGMLRPLDHWEKISISRIPMGHEILVTPLQMVMGVAAIANEGRLMRPLLVDRVQDQNGTCVWKYKPEVVRQAVSPAAARQMVQAMKTVVSSTGTASKARLDYYTVAGKTGTAQKFLNNSYHSGKYFSSFIGFFPADNPELCISVVLDEPASRYSYYGGDVAAPVFKAISERVANYLRLPPDVQPEPRPEPKTKSNPGSQPGLLTGPAYAESRPATPTTNRPPLD